MFCPEQIHHRASKMVIAIPPKEVNGRLDGKGGLPAFLFVGIGDALFGELEDDMLETVGLKLTAVQTVQYSVFITAYSVCSNKRFGRRKITFLAVQSRCWMAQASSTRH